MNVVALLPHGPATQADVLRLESKIDTALAELRSQKTNSFPPIMSTVQAMSFVKCKSRTAFGKWVNKFAPFARLSKNRFSRARLEIGRAREINGVKEPSI